MTRRIALAVAALLTSAVLAGTAAVTFGRGIVGASSAPAPAKPIVRTVTQVVTVKKHRPAPPGPVVTIVRHVSGGSAGHGGEHEHDGSDGSGSDD